MLKFLPNIFPASVNYPVVAVKRQFVAHPSPKERRSVSSGNNNQLDLVRLDRSGKTGHVRSIKIGQV